MSILKEEVKRKRSMSKTHTAMRFPQLQRAVHIHAHRGTVTGFLSPVPPGDPFPVWEVGPLVSEDGCFPQPDGVLKTKPPSVFFPYLGFGTLSSGTAVQTESGVFCSLNRPLNTFSMSSMLNAQTAEPGMLKGGKTIRRQGARSWVPQARTEHLLRCQGPALTC